MSKRVMQGTVVSDAADKTIVVRVDRRVQHPIYKKFMTRSNRFMAHDEANSCKVGDIVRILECRPISKHKSWEVFSSAGEG